MNRRRNKISLPFRASTSHFRKQSSSALAAGRGSRILRELRGGGGVEGGGNVFIRTTFLLVCHRVRLEKEFQNLPDGSRAEPAGDRSLLICGPAGPLQNSQLDFIVDYERDDVICDQQIHNAAITVRLLAHDGRVPSC